VWGITDEFHVAQRRVREALAGLPEGTVATIRLAVLDTALPRPEYRYGPVVARLHSGDRGRKDLGRKASR